jgi:hypothetical protein
MLTHWGSSPPNGLSERPKRRRSFDKDQRLRFLAELRQPIYYPLPRAGCQVEIADCRLYLRRDMGPVPAILRPPEADRLTWIKPTDPITIRTIYRDRVA